MFQTIITVKTTLVITGLSYVGVCVAKEVPVIGFDRNERK